MLWLHFTSSKVRRGYYLAQKDPSQHHRKGYKKNGLLFTEVGKQGPEQQEWKQGAGARPWHPGVPASTHTGSQRPLEHPLSCWAGQGTLGQERPSCCQVEVYQPESWGLSVSGSWNTGQKEAILENPTCLQSRRLL